MSRTFFAPLEYKLPHKFDEFTPTMLLLLHCNLEYRNHDLNMNATARFRDLALKRQTRGPTPSLSSGAPSRAPTPGPQALDAGAGENLELREPSPSPAPELPSSLPALSCSFTSEEIELPRMIDSVQVAMTEDKDLVICDRLLRIPGEEVQKVHGALCRRGSCLLRARR